LDSQILDSNYYDKGILQINFKSIDSKYTNNYILDPVDDIKVNGNKRLFLVNVTNNNSDVKTQKSGFALLRIDKIICYILISFIVNFSLKEQIWME
jgi:hypothetical protein